MEAAGEILAAEVEALARVVWVPAQSGAVVSSCLAAEVEVVVPQLQVAFDLQQDLAGELSNPVS